MKNDKIVIANKKFNSRLIVGTGKYKSMSECAKAIKLSGAEIVTVAVRRVNITDKKKPLLMDYIDPKKITYLPNTAGCFTSEEALRTLRLAREIGGWKLVKLEVLGDKQNLFPDMIETLKSTEVLAKEGFKVMVYCNDDPLMAKRLENSGADAIMPLAAPIGSGLGIQNKTNIQIIRNQTKLPLIIDAGLGQASDATIAMELGCDGVLVNTAIAKAKKPYDMALAFKNAVINKAKFVELRVCEKISDFLKENFVDDLTYFEKKNKMTIDIISDPTLIIPEYIINIQNKSKKTIELIEHFEKLKNLEIQIKEDKITDNKEAKKFHKKPFKKKPYFKKKFVKKTATI